MNLNNIKLTIKSKSLTEEAKIIKNEEQKILKKIRSHYNKNDEKLFNQYESIYHHRKIKVRNEARATILAKALLSGKSYSFVEKSRKREKEFDFINYVIPSVQRMFVKYGGHVNVNVNYRTMAHYKQAHDKALKEHIMAWLET